MTARNDKVEPRKQRAGPVALVLLGLIRLYQLSLSAFVGRHCRHLPTCSEYAMDAIRLHGAWAGFWLGFFRVMRCHPFGTHGLDPVPERGVPPHDPFFWRYARHGRCGGQGGNRAALSESAEKDRGCAREGAAPSSASRADRRGLRR